MHGFSKTRVTRAALGLAAVSAFAFAPMAAQAATTTATGTLGTGALSVAAPAITAFTASLTGVNQSVTTGVGAWSLNDSVGDGAAYNVSVKAAAPTIAGASIAGSLDTTWLTLTPTTAVPGTGNPATSSPTAIATPVALGATAAIIENAAADVGPGLQAFPADSGSGLSVVIPGNAKTGAYSDTLTYTIAAGVVAG